MTIPSEDDAPVEQAGQHRRFHKPQPSVRFRLTALYGGLFVLAGAGLVTVTNVLYRVFAPSHFSIEVPAILRLLKGATPPHQLPSSAKLGKAVVNFTRTVHGAPPNFAHIRPGHQQVVAFRQLAANIVQLNAVVQQHSDSQGVLVWSIVGFAVMAVVAIGLAWWLSGRALRPLRNITAAANTISATNLHERLALAGPDDELKHLTETFNDLLGRLEVAFDAQRRFVANASHELRTPLARQRAVAEVALSDPNATVESLRSSYQRVIAAGEEQERLIAALLLLARSDRGLSSTAPVDLDEIVRRSAASMGAESRARGIAVETALHGAPVAGDPELVERLVVNLVANAIEHNADHGFVNITTGVDEGTVRLSVENGGNVVDPDEIERLMRPFERANGARLNHDGRFGLGLSIVEAVARAHGARLDVRARESGGLAVTVEFPPTPPSASDGEDVEEDAPQ
jgi:signal transduction histidine kinase